MPAVSRADREVARLRHGVVVLAAALALIGGSCADHRGDASLDWPDATPDQHEILRVLSYNIRHGVGLDGQLDLERIARLINAVKPDLVVLQEVDRGTARTGMVDQAAVLGDLTGMTSEFGAFMAFDGGEYGMALLSRWEIISSRTIKLPDACVDCPCNPSPCPEARTSLVVVARSPATGRKVVLADVHLYQNEAERLAQARALSAELLTGTDPVVVAGDFNSERGTPVMDALAPEWRILDKDPPGNSFPASRPVREIDFVLLRQQAAISPIRHVVLDDDEAPMASVASDHRPILAELRLAPIHPD